MQLSLDRGQFSVFSVPSSGQAAAVIAADKIKVAVLGTGSLGKEHARLYAEFAGAGEIELTGVFDVSTEAARRVANQCGTRQFGSIAEAAAASDALSIVTPTTTHFEIAKELLAAGKHVLVEKPMTDNAEQAGELVQLALKHNGVLQVGHVERFNPVFQYLQTVATQPRFIETHRLSPYPSRSTDIGVVLDLMIHDLDVVLAFVKSPVTSTTASQPFNASASSTAMPAGLPRMRSTLVAPILPLPTVRMSMPRALATRKPVGMEPSR